MRSQEIAKTFNPFPGLRPFKEEEEHLFFGRESQVNTMVDALAATHFLVVLGPSGSGKSSLVNCGLRPALRRGLMAKAGTDWIMVQFRPGNAPLHAMAQALSGAKRLFEGYQSPALPVAELVKLDLTMSKRGLIDLFEQAGLSGARLLVVVDQFEELFRYSSVGSTVLGYKPAVKDAIAFVNLLLEVQEKTDSSIYVVLTIRSDFLGDCTRFPGLPDAINKGLYLVPRMSYDERLSAIASPVAVGGASLAPDLLTRLVNDVGDDPDQLPILQHALSRTWNEWEGKGGKGPITLSHYESIGTMERALDQHAEEAFEQLEPGAPRRVCEKVFKALTGTDSESRGIRRPTRLSALCELVDVPEEDVTQVINLFRLPERPFLTPPAGEPLTATSIVDISHESLMRVWKRLQRWTDEETESVQTFRRLAENAARFTAGTAPLLRDPELQLMLNWQTRREPTPAWAALYEVDYEHTMAFLAESEALRTQEEEIERARRRRLNLLLMSIAILGIFAAGAAFWGMQRAKNEKKALESAGQTANLFSAMLAEANPNIRLRYEPTASAYDTLTVFDLVDRADVRIRRELAEQPEVQAQMLNVIGEVYRQLGDYPKAREVLERAHALTDSMQGRETEEAARSLNSLGNVLASMDSLEAAKRILREALAIRLEIFGASHPVVAQSLNDLGLAISLQGDSLDLAESILRQALAIRQNFEDEGAEDLAQTQSNLGGVKYDQGDYQTADSLFREAIEIRKAFYGSDHPLLARSLNNLSVLLQDQADDLYFRADELDSLARAIAVNDSLQVDILLQEANRILLEADSIWKEAGAYAQQTFEMSERLLGRDHLEVAFTRFNLALIRWGELDYDAAEEHFRAAADVFLTQGRYAYVGLTYAEWGNMLLQQNDGVCSPAVEALRQLAVPLSDSLTRAEKGVEDLDYAVEIFQEACGF